MKQLPDPLFFERLATCPHCDYDMTATAADTPCPECGTPNSAGIMLGGVPRHLGGPAHRHVLRIVVILLPFVVLPAALIVTRFSYLASLSLLAAFALLVIWFFVSSPRERAAAERLLVLPRMLVRLPIDSPVPVYTDAVRIKFDAGSVIVIKRVGTQWASLQLFGPDQSTIFESGVRCIESWLPRLRDDLQVVVGPDVTVAIA